MGVVAIKVIQKTNQSLSTVKEQFREVDSLRTVNHPNIVKLLEVIDTEETLFIVMEYVSGGDLKTYLEAKGRMTEGEARGLFCQLVSALQHCHQRGVVHRDLKLGNLLLDANNNIKISDFGLSNQWHPGNELDTFCGSPAFMAPELFLGMPYTGPERMCEALSMSCTPWELDPSPSGDKTSGSCGSVCLAGSTMCPNIYPPT